MTGARVPLGSPLRGRIEVVAIESIALEGNVLGDPSRRDALVYLPPAYDRGARLPVVMVLAGYAATSWSSIAWRPFGEASLFDLYERAQRAGTPEAILVLPDAYDRWGGSQFIDSPATGRYQSHLVEVFEEIDRRYRTIARPEGRAVIGRSSGGFGALRLALDRPGLVSVVGSHAGDALFEVSIRPTFTSLAITFDREGGLASFVSRVEETGLRGGADFDAMMMLASAAAYAPEPAAPWPHCALPFDPATGLVVPEIWSRFLAHDPVVRLERDPRALADLALVYLDAGDRDEHGLHFAARRMAELLRARGANVHHHEFPGAHRGTQGRYAVSLPLVIAALAKE